MTEGGITMSRREVDRLGVIQAIQSKALRQREAARQMGLTLRHVERLVRRYRDQGALGLVSGHRGQCPNNTIGAAVHAEIMDRVRTRYVDFGPTLACKKLVEVHRYSLSVETLRQWMIAEGDKLIYKYDFGDGWQHELKIGMVLAPEPGARYPRCLKGKRACSPEDCGELWGYENLIQILANSKHEEYEEMREWIGDEIDPEAFDLDEVNQMPKRMR